MVDSSRPLLYCDSRPRNVPLEPEGLVMENLVGLGLLALVVVGFFLGIVLAHVVARRR